jgi:hypothetical protein
MSTTRGMGCTLSAAIADELASGLTGEFSPPFTFWRLIAVVQTQDHGYAPSDSTRFPYRRRLWSIESRLPGSFQISAPM